MDDPGEGELSVSLARTTVRLLVVALPLYFVWEMLQAPGWLAATAVWALATLGDGVIRDNGMTYQGRNGGRAWAGAQ